MTKITIKKLIPTVKVNFYQSESIVSKVIMILIKHCDFIKLLSLAISGN